MANRMVELIIGVISSIIGTLIIQFGVLIFAIQTPEPNISLSPSILALSSLFLLSAMVIPAEGEENPIATKLIGGFFVFIISTLVSLVLGFIIEPFVNQPATGIWLEGTVTMQTIYTYTNILLMSGFVLLILSAEE